MNRTADFRDANGNGIDDRDEKRAGNNGQNNSVTTNQTNQSNSNMSNNPYQSTSESVKQTANYTTAANTSASNADNKTTAQKNSEKTRGQIFEGMGFGMSMLEDLFSNPGDKDDDSRREMRNAFQFDTGSKFFNTMLGMAQSEFNLAQNMEGMKFANMLDRQTMQETRNHIHGLNMQTMDKQFTLNDEYANRDLSRNLSMLGATGEQQRKNMAAEGEQARLGTITSGEQNRKTIAATGEQNRMQAITEGEQQRLGIRETGAQQRQNIAATGEQNRLQAQTEGAEQRKNISATGIENRKQAVTEGEQQRLGIGKTAMEERTTMSHADNIAAGRESRQNARARAAARAF